MISCYPVVARFLATPILLPSGIKISCRVELYLCRCIVAACVCHLSYVTAAHFYDFSGNSDVNRDNDSGIDGIDRDGD